MLRAIRSSCARPQVVGRCRCLRFLPRQRRLLGLGSEGGLLQLLLLLFCRELRHSVAAPQTIEMDYILLVDLLLFLRRRIRTRDIEATVLQEIVVGISTTRPAPADELLVALGNQ